MCSGAILLYGIPRVVIGESSTFVGEEDLLRSRGVQVVVLNDAQCQKMMRDFIKEHPEVSTSFIHSFNGWPSGVRHSWSGRGTSHFIRSCGTRTLASQLRPKDDGNPLLLDSVFVSAEGHRVLM